MSTFQEDTYTLKEGNCIKSEDFPTFISMYKRTALKLEEIKKLIEEGDVTSKHVKVFFTIPQEERAGCEPVKQIFSQEIVNRDEPLYSMESLLEEDESPLNYIMFDPETYGKNWFVVKA